MGQVLDIVALRSLTAVADCGGFHRAATSLRISQSAVSQHVRRLEKVVGRPLVQRQGRQTEFTTDGRLLLVEARRILAAHDEALRRLIGDDQAIVAVGTTEHAVELVLPAITTALGSLRPARQVRFRIDRTARLTEAVDQGALDLAVFMAEAASERGVPLGALPLATARVQRRFRIGPIANRYRSIGYRAYRVMGVGRRVIVTIAPHPGSSLTVDGPLFKALLRRHAAAVVVVTAAGDPPAGFTATSFTSVSLDPPLISFCLADSASAAPVVARARTVAAHVLHRGQEAAARTFATRGIDRFAVHGAWTSGPDGVPLLDDVAARIICRVTRRVRAGDHTIVLATAFAGDLHPEPGATPLVYHDGAYTHLRPSAA